MHQVVADPKANLELLAQIDLVLGIKRDLVAADTAIESKRTSDCIIE